MLVADGNGVAIGFHLDSASPAEVRLAGQTLQSVRVRSRNGQFKTRPHLLLADRAYDSRAFGQSLRKRGIKVCIPPRRRPKNWRKKRGRPGARNVADLSPPTARLTSNASKSSAALRGWGTIADC